MKDGNAKHPEDIEASEQYRYYSGLGGGGVGGNDSDEDDNDENESKGGGGGGGGGGELFEDDFDDFLDDGDDDDEDGDDDDDNEDEEEMDEADLEMARRKAEEEDLNHVVQPIKPPISLVPIAPNQAPPEWLSSSSSGKQHFIPRFPLHDPRHPDTARCCQGYCVLTPRRKTQLGYSILTCVLPVGVILAFWLVQQA